MSRSHWSTVIALGLAVTLASLGGKWLYDDASRLQIAYEHHAEQKAKNYTDAARIRAHTRCADVPRKSVYQCVYDQYETARQGEHDEYDLQAQLVTSVWTRAMGIAAIIGMAIGILGVGLIFITFRENKRSADVAEDALAETSRPHLLLDQATIGNLTDLPLSDEVPVKFSFINHGSGPAWMREYGIGAWIRRPGEMPAIDEKAIAKTETLWSVDPKSGGWKVTDDDPPKITISAGQRADILAGTGVLFVALMIKYVEASGKAHEHRLVLTYEAATGRLVPAQNPFACYT